MSMAAAAETHRGQSAHCPGPVPTSEVHAETCAACGKCGVVTRFLESQLNTGRAVLAASREPLNA